MSFRQYLYAIFFACVSVPLLALGIQQFFFAKETLENRELVSKLSAELVGREIQSRLEIARTVVESAANKLAADGAKDPELLNSYLKDLVVKVPYILNIHYDNTKGHSIAFYPKINKEGLSNIGVDHTTRDHWKKIQSFNTPVVSDVVKAVGAADVPIVNVIIPARNKKGKLVGYAVCALNLNRLVDNATSRIAPGEFSIWVFDSKGVPVFTTDLVATLTPYLKPQEISRVLKTGGEWVTIERGNAADLSGYLLPLPDQNWAVGIFRKVPDKETEHGVLVWTNILFFLLVCLLTLIVGSTVNQVLVSKFKKLMNSVFDSKYPWSKMDYIESPEEFGHLQKLINKLSNQVRPNKPEANDINFAVEREFHRRISDFSERGVILNKVFDDFLTGLVLVDKNGEIRFANKISRRLMPMAQPGSDFLCCLDQCFSSDVPSTEWLERLRTQLTFMATGEKYELRMYSIKDSGVVDKVYVLVQEG